MPYFSSCRTSRIAAVVVVLLVIVLIVIWINTGTLITAQESTDFQSTISSVGRVSYQYAKDKKPRINSEEKRQYLPPVQSTTNAYKGFPEIVAINGIRGISNPVRTKTNTFSTNHREISYVTPFKISENQYEDPPDELSMGKRHHSGHFRLPTAIVWDPHPQYEFTAFGRTFRLRLTHDSSFISPDIKITHVSINKTIKDRPNHQLGCFYSGYVDGDPTSDVSVSLCDGMTGHVRTSNGSYIINPVQHHNTNAGGIIEHVFYQEPKMESYVSNSSGPDFLTGGHDCGVIDYDIDKEAPMAMRDDSSKGDMYVGDRHREKRSSMPNIFWDHSAEHGLNKRYNELEKLEDYRLDQIKKAEDPFSDWRYRRALAREYFIEIMIVADVKMVEYHSIDLVSYVLVLMSTVYRIYKDSSIGNPISIAVMKIVTVEQTFGTKDSEIDGISAAEMLKKFCQWQKFNNPNEPSTEHHDVALLLTRENLCQNPGQNRCETLGLAELGQMCSPRSSCAIVQDNGLATAFTIAHEIGHVLNMPHDDDSKCTKFRINTDVHNFMTRRLDNNTFRWEWSKCSRHYLTEFLENANCLLDEPSNVTSTPDMIRLPGEEYSGNRQCELTFGRGSQICSMKSEDVCKKLWCTSGIPNHQQCRTQNMPWADGTPCGDTDLQMKWCHRGECTSVKTLEPVNGQWGVWGPYGKCSRTCGGGIQKNHRECNSPYPQNGGDYCVGKRVKYRSCRTEECPLDAPDFRQEQCSKFDNNNLKIPGLAADIQWHSKYTRWRWRVVAGWSRARWYRQRRGRVRDRYFNGPY